MNRVLLLITCVVLALAFYGIGFHIGAMLVVGVGMFFEGLFWMTLVNPRRRSRER